MPFARHPISGQSGARVAEANKTFGNVRKVGHRDSMLGRSYSRLRMFLLKPRAPQVSR